jgi:hypothetical protein
MPALDPVDLNVASYVRRPQLGRKYLLPVLRARESSTSPTNLPGRKGPPLHSFQTLLADLSTIVRNSITPNLEGAPAWQQETEPSALQRRAFDLLKKHPRPVASNGNLAFRPESSIYAGLRSIRRSKFGLGFIHLKGFC